MILIRFTSCLNIPNLLTLQLFGGHFPTANHPRMVYSRITSQATLKNASNKQKETGWNRNSFFQVSLSQHYFPPQKKTAKRIDSIATILSQRKKICKTGQVHQMVQRRTSSSWKLPRSSVTQPLAWRFESFWTAFSPECSKGYLWENATAEQKMLGVQKPWNKHEYTKYHFKCMWDDGVFKAPPRFLPSGHSQFISPNHLSLLDSNTQLLWKFASGENPEFLESSLSPSDCVSLTNTKAFQVENGDRLNIFLT